MKKPEQPSALSPQPFTHVAHDRVHNLVNREIRSVDDGIGLVVPQRGVRAGGILLVAGDRLAEDRREVWRGPFCQQLLVSAACPDFRPGRQEELAARLGKDLRSNIAPFQDSPAPPPKLLLKLD